MTKPTLTAALLFAPSMFASFINNSTGIANPAHVITFSEVALAPNTEILSSYSGLGVTFSPGVRYNPTGAQGTPYPNFSGVFAANFGGSNPIANPMSIFFTTPQTAAAFALATQGGVTTTFDALLGGVLQATTSQVTTFTSSVNYFGFTGITFDQIRITEGAIPGGNGSLAFDNIQFGTVAEPGAVELVFSGLAGLALLRIRARRVRR